MAGGEIKNARDKGFAMRREEGVVVNGHYCSFASCPFWSSKGADESLYILNEELKLWGRGLQEDYDRDYVKCILEIHEEDCGTDKRMLYDETSDFISQDFAEFMGETRSFLMAVYGHGRELLANPATKQFVLEAIGLVELLADKVALAAEDFDGARNIYWMKEDYPAEAVKKRWPGYDKLDYHRRKGEVTLRNYEDAFEEITAFIEYLKESAIAIRFEQIAATLKAYCKIKAGGPGRFEEIVASQRERRIGELLEKDVVKAIIKALGTKQAKRGQIVGMIEYEEGGHVAQALHRCSKVGILIHERPFYRVHPELYNRLNICPDKNGQ